jgi:O-antigen/teichoic acid export membrane protein
MNAQSSPGRPSTLRGRVVRGAQAQVFLHVVRTIVQVGTVSLLVAGWGLDRYGEWLILAAVPSYIAWSDIGFTGAAVNEMLMAAGRHDRTQALVVFQATTLMLVAPLVVLSVVIPVVIALTPFADWLNLSTIDASTAAGTLLFLGGNAILLAWGGLPIGGFAAVGRWGEGVFAVALCMLIEFCALCAAVLLGGGPLMAAGTMFGVRFVATVALYAWMRHRAPWLRFGRPPGTLSVLKRLFHPAAASGILPTCVILNIQGMVLLIGITLGPASVAIFSTLRTLSRVVVQLSASVFAVMTPEISRAFGAGDAGLLRTIHRRGSQLTLWFALSLALGVGVLAGPILDLWTSGKVHVEGVVLYILLISAFIESLWSASLAILFATNRHLRVAIVYLIGSLLNLPVAYVLLELLGLEGGAVAVMLLGLFMLVPVLRQSLPAADDGLRGWLSVVVRPPLWLASFAAHQSAAPASDRTSD